MLHLDKNLPISVRPASSVSSISIQLLRKGGPDAVCEHLCYLQKLFSLEKWTGKICYFLGARDLKIARSDTPEYWKWTSLPESRFPEVAKLKHVVLLDIQVKVRACVLSPRASYAAYLVYKFEGESGFLSELLHVQSDIQRPKLRDDGWFEVELAVFYTESEDGYIEIHVKEAEGVAYQEESLIVEGIEIRPRMG